MSIQKQLRTILSADEMTKKRAILLLLPVLAILSYILSRKSCFDFVVWDLKKCNGLSVFFNAKTITCIRIVWLLRRDPSPVPSATVFQLFTLSVIKKAPRCYLDRKTIWINIQCHLFTLIFYTGMLKWELCQGKIIHQNSVFASKLNNFFAAEKFSWSWTRCIRQQLPGLSSKNCPHSLSRNIHTPEK